MQKILVICVMTCCVLISHAQKTYIKVKVTAFDKNVIPNANVELASYKDTTLIKTYQTDNDGYVEFRVKPISRYWVKISSTGYAHVLKLTTVFKDDVELAIELQKRNKANEIAVVKSKQPFQFMQDGVDVVNTKSIAVTSTNAFEVIEKTPGIITKNESEFYLVNNSAATILINGKNMHLPQSEIVALLKALQAQAVLQVQIQNTHNSSTDANTVGGTINIILQNRVKFGLSGSVFANYSIGQLSSQQFGATLSNTTKKITAYGTVGVMNNNNFENITITRFYKVDTALQQMINGQLKSWSPYIHYGSQFITNKYWEIGVDGKMSISFNDAIYDAKNKTEKASAAKLLGTNENKATTDANKVIILQNISSKYQNSNNKLESRTNIGFSYLRDNFNQVYSTVTTMPLSTSASGDGYYLSNKQSLDAQTVVLYKPTNSFAVELGVKNTTTMYENFADFYKNGAYDIERAGKYEYKENIAAVYLQTKKVINKLELKAGVRTEQTNMVSTNYIPIQNKKDIRRVDILPNIAVSYPIYSTDEKEIKAALLYSKNIDRPTYNKFNPYKKYINNYTSEIGNANLQPQLSQKMELNIATEKRTFLALGQNRINNFLSSVLYQNQYNKVEAFSTYDNLGSNTENYITISAGLPQTKKYFFIAGATFQINNYKGKYEGSTLDYKNTSWNIYMYHQLNVDKLTSITVQGWYQNGGLVQFYEMGQYGQANISISRLVLNKKLNIAINAIDMFFTNKQNFKILQGTVNMNGTKEMDTRRFGISLKYNLGAFTKAPSPNDYFTEAQNRN